LPSFSQDRSGEEGDAREEGKKKIRNGSNHSRAGLISLHVRGAVEKGGKEGENWGKRGEKGCRTLISLLPASPATRGGGRKGRKRTKEPRGGEGKESPRAVSEKKKKEIEKSLEKCGSREKEREKGGLSFDDLLFFLPSFPCTDGGGEGGEERGAERIKGKRRRS